MEPLRKNDNLVDKFKAIMHPAKGAIKDQKASVERVDQKIASVASMSEQSPTTEKTQSKRKVVWKNFKAWLSRTFFKSHFTAKRLVNPDSRLDSFQIKMNQRPNQNSVAFVSDQAREISLEPKFAGIAKSLRALSTVSTPEQAVKIIQKCRQRLLSLYPNDEAKWDASLRQELWRLLFFKSLDHPTVSTDSFVNHVEQTLNTVLETSTVDRKSKDYIAIVKDALNGMQSRLQLVVFENKLDEAKQNIHLPEEPQFKERVENFQKLICYPQETDLAYSTIAKTLESCLQNISRDTLEPYKQLVVHGGNPIWCSEQGQKKLSQVCDFLAQATGDNTILISKIKELQQAIQELMQ